MGRILGIRFPTSNSMTRFLTVLSVRSIQQNTQTTVLWGQSMLFSNSGLPQNLYFSHLLKEWSNKSMTWGELSQVPNRSSFPADYVLIPQSPPVAPIAVKQATLLNTGYDPLKGYWAEFAGNYNLYFGLFQGDWYNTMGQYTQTNTPGNPSVPY